MGFFRGFRDSLVLMLLSGGLLILGESDKVSHFENPALQSLDRTWWVLKRQWGREQEEFSQQIQILRMSYSSSVEFYFDDEAKKELVSFLKDHRAPILSNLDVNRLLYDSILKQLLDVSSFVRPISLVAGIPNAENHQLQELSSRQWQQRPISEPKPPFMVLPEERDYYDPRFRYGVFGSLLEDGSQFFSQFAVYHEPSHQKFPSAVLQALPYLKGCKDFRVNEEDRLDFENCEASVASLQLSKFLTLEFYPKLSPLNFPNDLKELDPNKVLILDLFTPPFLYNVHGERMSTAELMATALSNLELSHFFHSSIPVQTASLIFVLLFALLFPLMMRGFSATQVLLISLSLLGILIALDFGMTELVRLRTDPVPSFLAIMLSAGGVWLRTAGQERLQREKLERAFQGYVNSERLQKILSGEEKLELKGNQKELTTFMIDIVEFTKMTAKLKAEELFAFIREFFSLIDPIVLKHGGMIDKMTGDGLFAIFGDNEQSSADSARNAVEAGIEIQEKVRSHRFSFVGEIKIRVGINTGSLMIGNAGSELHFNYTVLGEAANLTERLQSACVPGQVLVGEGTVQKVRDHFTTFPHRFKTKDGFEMVGFLVSKRSP